MTDYVAFKNGVLTLCDDEDKYNLLEELEALKDKAYERFGHTADPYYEGYAQAVYDIQMLIKQRADESSPTF